MYFPLKMVIFQPAMLVYQGVGGSVGCHDVMGLFGYKKNWFWAQSWAKDVKTNWKKQRLLESCFTHRNAPIMSLIVKRDIFR